MIVKNSRIFLALVLIILLCGCDRNTAPSGAAVDLLPRLTNAITVDGRSVQLQLAHAGGGRLSLTWTRQEGVTKGDLTISAVNPDGTGPRPLAACPLTDGAAVIDLPADLPAPCRLHIELSREAPPGTTIDFTGASLQLDVTPLNVVLIVIDTLRPDYLGCYGAGDDASPVIDALAADGIVFEGCWCPTPITGPSHTSLFTSRLPSQHGIVNNMRGEIPSSLATLAEILDAAGLATGAAVSISPVNGCYGFDRGFDHYNCEMGMSWILNSDVVLQRTLDILADLEPPLFLWAHLSDPHEPYDAHGLVDNEAQVFVDGNEVGVIPTSNYTPTAIDIDLPEGRRAEVVVRSDAPFQIRDTSLRCGRGTVPSLELVDDGSGEQWNTEYRATIGADGNRRVQLRLYLNDRPGPGHDLEERYRREVAYSDHHVGLLLNELKTRGLYEESLVIFTADHGEALGQHGHVGHVHTIYDAMVRVPLIIKTPASWGDAGDRRQDPASLLDIVPTVLGCLGMGVPEGCGGRDLLAHDASKQTAEIFLETHRPESDATLFGLTDGRIKIIFEPESDTWEFYDLHADPREIDDLHDPADERIGAWREKLLHRLGEVASAEAISLDAVDEETREMLRSLGY